MALCINTSEENTSSLRKRQFWLVKLLGHRFTIGGHGGDGVVVTQLVVKVSALFFGAFLW